MISSGGMAVRARASIEPILLSNISVRLCSQRSKSCCASLLPGLRPRIFPSSSSAPEKSLSATNSREPRIHTSVSSSATASMGSGSLWIDQAPLDSSPGLSGWTMAIDGPSSQGLLGGGKEGLSAGASRKEEGVLYACVCASECGGRATGGATAASGGAGGRGGAAGGVGGAGRPEPSLAAG